MSSFVLPAINAPSAVAATTCWDRAPTLHALPGVPLTGTSGNDVIVGTAGIDDIDGAGGDDRICGMGGNDTLRGGSGDDHIDGRQGDDTIWAGAGSDFVRGDRAPDSPDTGNDVLQGGTGPDALVGGPGNDRVVGGDGSDLIYPGYGNDRVDGDGAADDGSSDSVGFVFSRRPVMLDLAAGTATGEGADKVSNIEDASGSCWDDELRGTPGTNFLFGGPGDDRLIGLGGQDAMTGDFRLAKKQLEQAGIVGCEGDGNDRMSGGPGDDLVSYYRAVAGVRVNLATSTATGQGTDTLTSITIVTGSDHPDVLTGDGERNFFFPDGGNDTVSGGAGFDTVSYSDLAGYFSPKPAAAWTGGHIDADFVRGTARIRLTSSSASIHETDRLGGLEGVVGSEFNDSLAGNGAPNFLAGGGGVDHLMGMAGDDVLNGGRGEDVLTGGAGNRDIVDYFLSDVPDVYPVCVVLGTPSTDVCLIGTGTAVLDVCCGTYGPDGDFTDPQDEVDTLAGFEGAEGTSSFDVLFGDAGSNELYGLGADDVLAGGDGPDYLEGNDDLLTGGDTTSPGDALFGEAGTDQCSTGEAIYTCEGTNAAPEHPILQDAVSALIDDVIGRIRRSGI